MTGTRAGRLRPYARALVAGCLALGAAACHESQPSGASPAPADHAIWTMLDVCTAEQQADAHLIRFPDGTNILVDTGRSGQVLLGRLKRLGIEKLDRVVITHFHDDHYGGLADLVRSGIRVLEVDGNLPNSDQCAAEPWGCRPVDLAAIVKLLADAHIPLRPLQAGQVLYGRSETRLETLYVFDGLRTPVGKTDINDMSAILLLSDHGSKALLTGDLNAPIGSYLAREGKRLEAAVLKVPHHGADSLAPDAFFDRVHPRVALVPAPAKLWASDRDRRARVYFTSKGIPTYVSGLDGDVQVDFNPSGVEVTSEKKPSLPLK